MPSKYVTRHYQSHETYHVYNRGVEKRLIFMDDMDYKRFLFYLHVYLLPPQLVESMYPQISQRLLQNNLNGKIDLLAYCLMPNHFHLLLTIKSEDSAVRLLKQVTNAYTKYFNSKYDRVGSLMQGTYKAIPIKSDESLLQVSRYIHQNAQTANLIQNPFDYKWSSLGQYMSPTPYSLCKTSTILRYFRSPQHYGDFVYKLKPAHSH